MNTRQDKDLITDVLMTEKSLCATYNTAVTEAATSNVREGFKNILNEQLDIQNDIFNTMNQKGWYNVQQADQNNINTIKTQFNQNI